MNLLGRFFLCVFISVPAIAQQGNNAPLPTTNPENIYTIRKQFLEKVLHNPTEENMKGDDNELEQFDRWFHFAEPRCYPTGDMPRPDILLSEYAKMHQNSTAHRTSTAPAWLPLGPKNIPWNFFGVGR